MVLTVEYKDNEKDFEILIDGERETDEDTMQNDAKLQNENTDDLRNC